MQTCEQCHSKIADEAAYCPFCGARVQGQVECDEYEYIAFVSYRHLPLDSRVAMRLQRGIEGFKIPRDLRTSASDKRLGRLFRDEDELPTTSSLSAQIERALKRSRFLIVVCTPETKKSLWVLREVELFASYHGRDRVLIALADGEPSQSFPELLLSKRVSLRDGEPSCVATEPLAADLRRTARKSFQDEMLRIVATLMGCGYDSLRQRDRARRNASIAVAIGIVAMIALNLAGVTAYHQRQVLVKHRELQTSQSRYLAIESAELLAEGDRMQAIQVALGALPQSSSSNDRPFVPEAQAALENATQVYDTSYGWVPCFSHSEGTTIDIVACNEESGAYAVVDRECLLHVYDMVSGEVRAELHLARDIKGLGKYKLDENATIQGMWFASPDALVVWPICSNETHSILCVDPYKKKLRWKITEEIEGLYVMNASVSDDESVMCVTGFRSERTKNGDVESVLSATVIDMKTGSVNKVLELERGKKVSLFDVVALDEKGRRLCAIEGDRLSVVDLGTGRVSTTNLPYSQEIVWELESLWVGDDLIVISADDTVEARETYAVQKFSSDCKEMWRTDIQTSSVIVDDRMYANAPALWGRLDAAGDMDEGVLASIGGRLMCLSLKDGSIADISNNLSTVIACKVTDIEKGQRIDVCTFEGEVSLLVADASGIGVSSAYSESIGYVTAAEFCDADGMCLIARKGETETSNDMKTTVYSFREDPSSNADEPALDDIELPEMLTEEKLRDRLAVLEDSLQSVPFDAEDVQFAMMRPDGKEAIVQEAGRVMRVSVPSGAVIALTTEDYEGFVAGGFCAGGELFYAQCPIFRDHALRNDLLVFNMGAQRWSPQSVIRYGAMLTDDASEVIIDAGTTSSVRLRLPYLGLDELIERGRELSRGFALTDAERQEYLM